MLKQFLGDRAFYRRVIAVALPIIIQNAITNFVSMLDNIMVGQVGTIPMSGVSIVNQLLFVFNLCVFGATSGAGIFTAQFFGSDDQDGIRHTFRFKFLVALVLGAAGIGLFSVAGSDLIRLYLRGEGTPEDLVQTLVHGLDYLKVMLWGLVPFALANAYSGTLRECGQTSVPMVAGVIAVLVNLCLNYVLIFGKFGAPIMGVRGAALATVISRYVELAIVAIWVHLHPEKNPYIRGVYRSMRIPRSLLKGIFLRGMPLLINEALWASGMAIMNQCYSVRGLDVVAALNISTTLWNLASVMFLSVGNAVGIIMGQILGAGTDRETVKSTNKKLIFTSVVSCLGFSLLLALLADVFPNIYKTTDAVRHIATQVILVGAVMMPFNAYTHATYFTLRSGGQTFVTFLFDSCFVWCICVPLAYCLSRFTAIPIVPLYILCHTPELLKCILGTYMLKKGSWIQNLTEKT